MHIVKFTVCQMWSHCKCVDNKCTHGCAGCVHWPDALYAVAFKWSTECVHVPSTVIISTCCILWVIVWLIQMIDVVKSPAMLQELMRGQEVCKFR